jgi:hypothetical protein
MREMDSNAAKFNSDVLSYLLYPETYIMEKPSILFL